jgi:uncharacterized membrane protein
MGLTLAAVAARVAAADHQKKADKKESKMAVKRMNMLIRTIIVSLLVIGTTTAFAFSLGKYEKVKPNGTIVTVSTTKLSDGKARFFKFEDSGKEISFFVVKSADGSIKTAFDACDACYREKKGYEQHGDKMNCKNCNQKFAINRLGPNASGGCNPGYLPHQVNGSTITIQTSDLKAGARYF